MPLYQYKYVDSKGKKCTGLIEAQNEREARSKLREQRLIVTYLALKTKIGKRQNLKGDDLITFTMQLSQLVNAGIPLYESLLALEEQMRGEPFHRIVMSLSEQIKMGISLSTAMSHYPESFDKLYCAMIAAGEAVGSVGSVLDKLTYLLNRHMKLKKQITTALIYPIILGGFSLLVISLLMGFVIPSLEGIFAERPLNGFTKFVITVSHLFRNYWWIYLPLLIASISWGVWRLRSPAGRLWLESFFLKLPVIKHLVMQTAVARFCRTLASLLQGGLSMIDSLRIARGVIRNVVIEKDILRAEGKIIEGHALSQELGRSAHIPSLVPRMLAVGEESGSTVVMLSKIADMYEQELEKTLERIMALAQPVILIVMGLIIGSVLLAVLLPLTDVSSFST